MRQMVLWDTACNFNTFISNQSIFNCLITGASTLLFYRVLLLQNAYTAVQCEHDQCALFQLYLMMRIDAHQVAW